MTSFPDLRSAVFVLVDVQEKLAPAINGIEEITGRLETALNAVKLLDIPLLVNEQYPKGLGHTLPSLKEIAGIGCPVFEKTSFSCFGSSPFRTELSKNNFKTVVIAGIETHVCVQQTAFDALEKGYEVLLLADASGSRHAFDKETALRLMLSSGVKVTTVEAFLFATMRESSHPAFKQISRLVR